MKHQENLTYTTLGSDYENYCFMLTHNGENSRIEIHKRFDDGCSTFDNNSFVTAIPLNKILKYVSDIKY